MKNKISLAIIVAMGLASASCSSDFEETNSANRQQNVEQHSKNKDSIPEVKDTPTVYLIDDIIIRPPKP